MRRLVVAVALFLFISHTGTIQAQQGTAKTAPSKRAVQKQAAMTNQDVIGLVKAGFDDDLVVTKIKQAPDKSFDLSTNPTSAVF